MRHVVAAVSLLLGDLELRGSGLRIVVFQSMGHAAQRYMVAALFSVRIAPFSLGSSNALPK